MKQKLCIISEYDKDFALIDILRDSDRFELKVIFLAHTSKMSTKYINEVSIVNNTHVEYFDLCDAIYFSNNCSEEVKYYKNIASEKGKLINSVNKAIDRIDSTAGYNEINVPVFLISGTNSDCGKNQVISALSREIRTRGERLAVISNYENADLLGYYKYPMDMMHETKTFNEKIMILNQFMHQILEKSKCSILLISVPGGMCNPFFPNDCESEILMYVLSKACVIDYIIYMLPVNLWLQDYVNKIGSKISGFLAMDIDYWIMSLQMYDATLFDNAYDTNSIPVIDILDENVENVYNRIVMPQSSYITHESIGCEIVRHIIDKLHRSTELCKIL